MKVHHCDMLALGYCNRGAREFCARHEINWQLFVQHGIELESLKHIDDHMLKLVIERARLREKGSGNV